MARMVGSHRATWTGFHMQHISPPDVLYASLEDVSTIFKDQGPIGRGREAGSVEVKRTERVQ